MYTPNTTFKLIQQFQNSLKYCNQIRRISKTVLAVLPPNAEEMEYVIIVDTLRRGGISVVCAGLEGADPVKCQRDVIIVPDKSLASAAEKPCDAIVLPGGVGGAKAMSGSKRLGEILKEYETGGRIVAAICAAPTVLFAHSIGLGKHITSYPAMKKTLEKHYNYNDKDEVVQDGQLITSRGPGTAIIFALKLVEVLAGKQQCMECAEAMLWKLS